MRGQSEEDEERSDARRALALGSVTAGGASRRGPQHATEADLANDNRPLPLVLWLGALPRQPAATASRSPRPCGRGLFAAPSPRGRSLAPRRDLRCSGSHEWTRVRPPEGRPPPPPSLVLALSLGKRRSLALRRLTPRCSRAPTPLGPAPPWWRP